jgi:hypothetical protein
VETASGELHEERQADVAETDDAGPCRARAESFVEAGREA